MPQGTWGSRGLRCVMVTPATCGASHSTGISQSSWPLILGCAMTAAPESGTRVWGCVAGKPAHAPLVETSSGERPSACPWHFLPSLPVCLQCAGLGCWWAAALALHRSSMGLGCWCSPGRLPCLCPWCPPETYRKVSLCWVAVDWTGWEGAGFSC